MVSPQKVTTYVN